MGSSSALSSYLAILFPWLLIFANHYKNRVFAILSILTISLSLTTIILTQGRASWFALVGSTLFIIFYKSNKKIFSYKEINKLTKKISLIFLTCFSITILVLVFNFKKDSANGRFLIWEVTTEIVKDYPILGVGYGNFGNIYPLYQAEFTKNNIVDTRIHLANDVNHSLNEFLQIITEMGLIGLFFLLGILIFTFKRINYKNKFVFASQCTILCFCILSLFTYPLKIFSIQILFFLFLAIVSSSLKTNYHLKLNKTFSFLFAGVFLVITILIVNSEFKRFDFEKSWRKTDHITKNLSWKIRSKQLNQLIDYRSNNWFFLMQFSSELISHNEYKKAIKILKKAEKLFKTSDLYYYLGICYENLGELNEAKKAFEIAVNIVPHKFLPKYRLTLVYDKINMEDKAVEMAKKTITMPAKINSRIVQDIKMKLREFLELKR